MTLCGACLRKNKAGKQFISELFEHLKGSWEIKQVLGAEYAGKVLERGR